MNNLKPRLYSYKMTHVTGKAPRVYEDELVLPACKPKLRTYIQPGDWMAGWTSKSLKPCPTEVGEEQLVYLALVDRKIAPDEYRNCPEKTVCVPIQPEKEGCYPEEECDEEAPVLICKEFYYFGAEKSLEVPEGLRPRVPVSQDFKGWETAGENAARFIDFVRQHAAECVKSNKN